MPQQRSPQPQPGDLLLYRGHGRWYEKLIQHYTHGCFVHCEVVCSPTQSIGALTSGITLHDIPGGYTLIPCGAALRAENSPRLLRALLWLDKQQLDGYGWLSIAADALKALLPHSLGARTPFLISPRRWDCSELALRFLIRAGFEGIPDALFDEPETCSPNDIARIFGIL